MRRTQRGEPAGVRQHHRELVLVEVGFVGAKETVLQHPPPGGGLLQRRVREAPRRVPPLEEEIGIRVVVNGPDRHGAAAGNEVRAPGGLDRHGVRVLPGRVVEGAVEAREVLDLANRERPHRKPVDRQDPHGGQRQGGARRCRRDAERTAGNQDRVERPPAVQGELRRDVEDDIASEAPGDPAVEVGEAPLRAVHQVRVHQQARGTGGEDEPKRQPVDEDVDRLPPPSRVRRPQTGPRRASSRTRPTCRARTRKVTYPAAAASKAQADAMCQSSTAPCGAIRAATPRHHPASSASAATRIPVARLTRRSSATSQCSATVGASPGASAAVAPPLLPRGRAR